MEIVSGISIRNILLDNGTFCWIMGIGGNSFYYIILLFATPSLLM